MRGTVLIPRLKTQQLEKAPESKEKPRVPGKLRETRKQRGIGRRREV